MIQVIWWWIYTILGTGTAAIVLVPILLCELWNKITAYNNKTYKSKRLINWLLMTPEQNMISLSIDVLFLILWTTFALVVCILIWPFILISILLIQGSPLIQWVITLVSAANTKFKNWLLKQNVKRMKGSTMKQQ